MRSRFFLESEIKDERIELIESFKLKKKDNNHGDNLWKIGSCFNHVKKTKRTGDKVKDVDHNPTDFACRNYFNDRLEDVSRKYNGSCMLAEISADRSGSAIGPVHSKLAASFGFCPVRCDEDSKIDAASDKNLRTVNESAHPEPIGHLALAKIIPCREPILKSCESLPRLIRPSDDADGVLQNLIGALSGLRVVRGAYHKKLDVAVRLAEELEHLALSWNTSPSFSSISLPYNSSEIRELAKACGFLLIFLRRLGGRLATRISRERSNCHVTRVARARLCRCFQST
jgi:hypothetical protein